jgi:hypothetical protein
MAVASVFTSDHVYQFTGFKPEPGVEAKPAYNRQSVEVTGLPTVIKKADGEPLDGTNIKVNQRIELTLGQLNAKRYLELVPNPELFKTCQVQMNSSLLRDESAPLVLHLLAFKATDLSQLKYLVRIVTHEG